MKLITGLQRRHFWLCHRPELLLGCLAQQVQQASLRSDPGRSRFVLQAKQIGQGDYRARGRQRERERERGHGDMDIVKKRERESERERERERELRGFRVQGLGMKKIIL